MPRIGVLLLLLAFCISPVLAEGKPSASMRTPLIGDPATRTIYLLLDGQRRLVPDTATLQAFGFAPEDVHWVDAAILAAFPIGPNLLPARIGDLVRDEGTGIFYLLDRGKRAIASEKTLEACGWNSDRARLISSTLAVALPDAPPVPDLRPGDLVRQAEDGCIYLLARGKHWLPSEGIIAAGGWREKDVRALDPALWALIPEGDLVPTLYAGSLLGSADESDERIYILDEGKHLIPDAETFAAYGWKRSEIVRLSPEVLAAIPQKAPLARVKKGDNPFALANWGECTWYVAERRLAPSYRSAKYWYEDAQANGFAVGQRPMPGAIIVYGSGSGRGIHGHVAYVEAAYPDGTFIRADSNICGWECVRTRITTLSQEAGVLGFVYWKYEAEP